MSSYGYFLDDIKQVEFIKSRDKGSVIIGELPKDASYGKLGYGRDRWTNDGYVFGLSAALNQGKKAINQGFNLWQGGINYEDISFPGIGSVFAGVDSISNKKAFAEKILKAGLCYYEAEFPSSWESEETSEGGYVIWAQDIEYHPVHVKNSGGNANEVYAGITALLWAGRQLLGDDFIIAPVPSSSIFKSLSFKEDGSDLDINVVLNDYLGVLGLDNLPNPSQQSSGEEWNFLSVLFHNNIIDGFIGQQYSTKNTEAWTGSVSADTRNFYPGQDLPYAILSAWSNPYQLIENQEYAEEWGLEPPPWNSYYNGDLPFNAGAYFGGENQEHGGAASHPTDLDLSDYLTPTKQSLPSLQLASDQEEFPILNFSGLDNHKIDVNISVKNNISQDFILGYYSIKDDQGSVLDPLTGDVIRPGEDGYGSAALNKRNQVSGLTSLIGNDSPSTNWAIEDLKEDDLIAPYLQVIDNHFLKTFFAFDDANSGDFSHFKNLGVNSYGVDTNFDGKPADYKDLMIALTFPDL